MRKKGNVGMMKQSKSASDITKNSLDRKHEFCCFPSRLGTRSLSHDSIFLPETHQADPEPPWVLSQENVHGKIQAIQIKLQRQKMHLGPPPLVWPIKQTKGNQQPSKVLLSKNQTYRSSSQGDLTYPLSPSLPPVYSSAPAPAPGVDFSTLPQLIPCLDNAAARHRMSVKPRNQRASTKSRRMPTSHGSRPRSESMIILDRPLTAHKDEDGIAVTKEMTFIRSYKSQLIRPERGHIAPPTKSPSPSLPPNLLVRAEADSNPHAVGQCHGKEEPAVRNTADGGTKQIRKLAEGIVVERTSSSELNSQKGSVCHRESLCRSKPKNIEGSSVSVVSSVYTTCQISFSTKQSQAKSDEKLNIVTTHVKGNASNEPRVQDTMEESYLQSQPPKPFSLQRNESPFNNKSDGRIVNQMSSHLLSKEESCLQEATNQQQSLRVPVSSDKSQERHRTRSFTGQTEQEGGKQKPPYLFIKPTTNLTQDLHRNARVMETGKDPSQTEAISTLEVLTKPRDLTITVSAGQEVKECLGNKTKAMAVMTQIGVLLADDANKKLKMNKVSKEQKEERIPSEVKLHATSPSEINDNQHNTEVRSTPWLPDCTTPIAVDQSDSKVGPVRETVFKSPPLYSNEPFISADPPVFSSTLLQSARSDHERTGFIRLPDLHSSTHLPDSAINIIMSIPVHVMEKEPLQTSAKESRDDTTELSWMIMAREKTRTLQQLFTSTLNDLAGLQTTTRPASATLTQLSSQYITSPKHQMSSEQPSISPLETQLPTLHASIQATHQFQSPLLKSSMSLAQPTIDQSLGADLSSKPPPSPTSQVQPTDVSARTGQMSTHSATKAVKSTEINVPSTQIIHATQQELSQMALHEAYQIQQSLSHSVTNPQASQSLHLSPSPKLTPCQSPNQSPSPVSRHRPLVENISCWPLEKVDWTSMPQGKSQAQYAGGLASKALHTEQWRHQEPGTGKVDQKSNPDSRTYQFLDEFANISSHSKFTDREVKWQKKTFPPPSLPSSSHLQSNHDSRQPSWMKLAKGKSMTWNDKSMD